MDTNKLQELCQNILLIAIDELDVNPNMKQAVQFTISVRKAIVKAASQTEEMEPEPAESLTNSQKH